MTTNRKSRTVIQTPQDDQSLLGEILMSAELMSEMPINDTRMKKKHGTILAKLMVSILSYNKIRVMKHYVTELDMRRIK